MRSRRASTFRPLSFKQTEGHSPLRDAQRTVATRGGTEVLGWDTCGSLAPGMRADLVLWDMSGLEALGAWDPIAALILCAGIRPRDVFVEGRRVVENGQLAAADTADIHRRAKSSLRRLMS